MKETKQEDRFSDLTAAERQIEQDYTMSQVLAEKQFEADEVESITPDPTHDGSIKELKRVTRKVDRRLIPILGVLYSISGIDRTNASPLYSPLSHDILTNKPRSRTPAKRGWA